MQLYKMVIVDDEEFILEKLKSIFDWEKLGFKIQAGFLHAADAKEYILNNDIDVLFTDIRIGVENGLDLATDVLEHNPNIEVVLLSAYSDFEYARLGIRLNAFDYLLKPVSHEDIVECFTCLKKGLDIKNGILSSEAIAVSNSSDSQNYQIEIAKKYIEEHYNEDIILDDIAGHVSMNSAYFSRFFKQHTNEHFSSYLMKVRLDNAIILLADPTKKVYEISNMVGYKSKRHFNNIFKKYTGKTPLEYRNEVLRIPDNEE